MMWRMKHLWRLRENFMRRGERIKVGRKSPRERENH
jgi:hypothetical protein